MRPHLEPHVLEDEADPPFLEDGQDLPGRRTLAGVEIPLGAERPSYGLVEVPVPSPSPIRGGARERGTTSSFSRT